MRRAYGKVTVYPRGVFFLKDEARPDFISINQL